MISTENRMRFVSASDVHAAKQEKRRGTESSRIPTSPVMDSVKAYRKLVIGVSMKNIVAMLIIFGVFCSVHMAINGNKTPKAAMAEQTALGTVFRTNEVGHNHRS